MSLRSLTDKLPRRCGYTVTMTLLACSNVADTPVPVYYGKNGVWVHCGSTNDPPNQNWYFEPRNCGGDCWEAALQPAQAMVCASPLSVDTEFAWDEDWDCQEFMPPEGTGGPAVTCVDAYQAWDSELRSLCTAECERRAQNGSRRRAGRNASRKNAPGIAPPEPKRFGFSPHSSARVYVVDRSLQAGR